MIERLDDWAFENQGIMLILDITFITVAVMCTIINVKVLLH